MFMGELRFPGEKKTSRLQDERSITKLWLFSQLNLHFTHIFVFFLYIQRQKKTFENCKQNDNWFDCLSMILIATYI